MMTQEILFKGLSQKLESLKELSKHVGGYSVLILGLAAIGQIIKLISIKSGLNFFSWNQVLNDAVILGVQFILSYFVLNLGLLVGDKINIKDTKYRWLGRLYRSIVLQSIILLLLIATGILLAIFLPIMQAALIFLLAILSFLFVAGIEKKLNSKQRKEDDSILASNLLEELSIVIFLIIITYYSNSYDSLYTKIDNQEAKIEYMNDQYIFSSGAVYTKDGGMMFYNK